MSFVEGLIPILRPIILLALSGVLSYSLMPLCHLTARTIGAVDLPDGGKRRVNTEPVPRAGGIGFFLASLVAVALSGTLGDGAVGAIFCGGALLTAFGLSDDTVSLSPPKKLIGQFAAAFVALTFIAAPTEFSFFGIFSIALPGIFGYLFALFRILFTINAVNFSDGLDGLAAGLSAVALTSLAILGAVNGRLESSLCALILTSALLGFLPFNKHKARIFMGDSGSQFLGYAIAVLSLASAEGNRFTLESSLFLAIPVLDTWVSVARRLLKGKSPFAADKGHLHHVLLSFGLSHEVAVRVLVSAGGLVALFVLFLSV